MKNKKLIGHFIGTFYWDNYGDNYLASNGSTPLDVPPMHRPETKKTKLNSIINQVINQLTTL